VILYEAWRQQGFAGAAGLGLRAED
jgi:hypothetical protein